MRLTLLNRPSCAAAPRCGCYPSNMAVEPLAMCYPGPQPGLDADVAKIMDTTMDELRGAGAVLVDVDFTDLIKTALAVRAPLRPEDFRTDLAAFLASEYPVMTMKDVIPRILSKRVRMLEEDAWEHPPPREAVEKARSTMDVLGTQYWDAFR